MCAQHRARKRFGQHFLTNTHVLQAIVDVISPTAGDHMVEIGPGLGALTQLLVAKVEHLDAVELDRDLVPKLKNLYLPLGNFSIHSADALKFDFCSLAQSQEKLRLVGNLPYNISTPLIFHLLEQVHCIDDMHFMLQKEVVERMAAQANSPNYGKLSVMIQYHCQVDALLDVSPDAFSPPPKVDSAVVRLAPYQSPPVTVGDAKVFESLVAQAFSQRRKTLRNTLKKVMNEQQLEQCGVDPSRRAQTLTLEEFAFLSRHISKG